MTCVELALVEDAAKDMDLKLVALLAWLGPKVGCSSGLAKGLDPEIELKIVMTVGSGSAVHLEASGGKGSESLCAYAQMNFSVCLVGLHS